VIDDLAWNVDGPWTKIESNCFLIFFKATPTFHFNIARIIYKKNLQTIFFLRKDKLCDKCACKFKISSERLEKT
jgi:hypothetical protein